MSTDPTTKVPYRPLEAARMALTRIPADQPLTEVFSQICEISSAAIKVERVGVWLFVDDKSAIHCVDLYERSRRDHSNGTIIHVADFPQYFAALSIRKAVPAEIASSDPSTSALRAAYLKPLGITSMLDAGIFLNGELVGVVCHEHIGPPREWTTEDRDFAGSVADFLALRMQSAEVAEMKAAFRTHEKRIAAIGLAESMSNMVYGVAHDFRNLLTIVLGNADAIRTQSKLDPNSADCLNILSDAAERGVGLTGELLEFARPKSQPPSVINLCESIEEFLPLLRSSAGHHHRIQYTRSGQISPILADKGQIQRIVLNLVLNARDAMAESGDIGINIRVTKVRDGDQPLGTYVMMAVSDTGCGMDEKTLAHCFDPFFTTKEKGTGVGLAIVRKLADRAGGFVQVESEVGVGTTIRVFFPRIGASTGETSEHPALVM